MNHAEHRMFLVPSPVARARSAPGVGQRLLTFSAVALAVSSVVGCGGGDEINAKPKWVGTISEKSYDGVSDDLLTAGLGATGLASAVAPAPADPLKPTVAELRRTAIHTNYRAIVDATAAGGFGSLYGPTVAEPGTQFGPDGKIAGTEFLAFADDGTGKQNVTLMVQVPNTFNAISPCIITATSSGSRGVYGGIATGEWGLKRGCAVAYTDKGTGGAPHDLMADTVPLLGGDRATATSAGTNALFQAGLSEADRVAFNAATPNRFAFKHAHSGQNSEKSWGLSTLRAVEFAFYVVNQRYGALDGAGNRLQSIKPSNTVVIASGLSNGGGAAVAAAEQDTQGWIDGVAVSEPQVNLPASAATLTVLRGGQPVSAHSKPLYDYTSHANLYQACASLAPSIASGPYAVAFAAGFASAALPIAPNRCASLKAAGLLQGNTTAELAEDALRKMLAHGWEAESSLLHPSHAAFEVAPAITVTYANAYARASVKDNLCGFSYAATAANGSVTTVNPAALASMAATGNGVPSSAGINLVNNQGALGAARDFLSVNAVGGADWNLQGALCLRALFTGTDAVAQRLQTGLNEVRLTGNLRGKPTLIVHGRSDALLPPNHTSRPYAALNRQVEGTASKLSYIEVTNAQHFDGFIGLPAVLAGYDTRFIPLHVYLNRSLDAMMQHLRTGAALPPSQVVRTVPRGGTPGAAPALTAAHVPAWVASPGAADAIALSAGSIRLPD